MKKIIFGFALAALVLLPFGAQAATIAGGENYALRSGETVNDNLYAAGGTVVITGKVAKDLLAAGGNVRLDGEVGGDIFSAGGTIDIGGKVGGDVRAAGGNLFIAGAIGGELVVVGGNVHLLPGATVAGDVLVAGGQLTLDGTVGGKVEVAGGEINLAGTVAGPVVAQAEKVSVASSARLGGGLAYKAPAEAKIADGAKIEGTPKFERVESGTVKNENARRGFAAMLGAWWFAKLLMMIAVGLTLLGLFRRKMAHAVTHSMEHFGLEMFRGFAGLILIPVASILVLFTMIGLPFTVIGLFSYVVLLIVANSYTTIFLGALLARYAFKKTGEGLVGWQWVVAGTIVYAVLGLIPVIGWLAGFLACLISFGSVLTFVGSAWAANR